MESHVAWMALDIGGANIKAAHSSNVARTLPFELWKRPDDLAQVLAKFAASFPQTDRIALTMTAELCDCYATKTVGVLAVLDAAEQAFRGIPLQVWGTDSRFHEVAVVRSQPLVAAASNWLALATVAARLVPQGPGLLIDVGTTTSDLIPLLDGRPMAQGRTDTERLQTGELVYAGVRRTPVCALATELLHRGKLTGLAAELFATTHDIYLTLRATPPDPKDHATADGRPATLEASRNRLARMVGADSDAFSEDDAFAFATAAHECLLERLAAAAERVSSGTIGRPQSAVVAGSGEFLARELASRLITPGGTVIALEEAWGSIASVAGCAFALLALARETFDPVVEIGAS